MDYVREQRFLNMPGHHSVAAISAFLDYRKSDYNGEGWFKSGLVIADCDRAVRFEFDFENEDEWKNNLYKIDQFLEVFKSFRKGMVDARKDWRASKKR